MEIKLTPLFNKPFPKNKVLKTCRVCSEIKWIGRRRGMCPPCRKKWRSGGGMMPFWQKKKIKGK